jgi:hypothetical protein
VETKTGIIILIQSSNLKLRFCYMGEFLLFWVIMVGTRCWNPLVKVYQFLVELYQLNNFLILSFWRKRLVFVLRLLEGRVVRLSMKILPRKLSRLWASVKMVWRCL